MESISLSHTDSESCACLTFAGPASVDIERCVPRVNAFYRRTFTDAERDWVCSGSGNDKIRSNWLFTLLWTFKESALKLESVDQTGVWDLPQIEIGDLPEADRFLTPRSDSVSTSFSMFRVCIREPHRARQVQVAVTGSRNLILSVMNPLRGVIN
jgi:hypothetical protein